MSTVQLLPPESDVERRWTAGAWLTLLAVMTLWVAAAGSAYAALRQPTDGWYASQDETLPPLVAYIGEWSTTLRVGDRVTAIDGVATRRELVAPDSPIARPTGWRAEGSVPYTIIRDSQTLTIEVPIGVLSDASVMRAFLTALSDTLAEWGYLLIGALIFALRPGNNAARLLFLFGGSYVAISKLAWAAPSIVRYTPPPVFYTHSLVNAAWGYAIIPALLLLVLSFPRATWPVRRFPRLVPTLLFGGALVVSMLATVTANGMLVVIVMVGQTVAFLLAVVITPTLTLWRSRDPVERAQTAWMLLGVGLSIGLTLLYYQLSVWVPGFATTFDRVVPGWFTDLLTLAMPLCLGIAIMRYRLFDIAVIIRRTLVYSLLTLTLGVTYLIGVVALQALFVRLTGQESALAVVASTLAIAALFGPLRRRVQAIIDRRFFRRKYDAQQVLQQFAQRVQQQADIDALAADIVGVVHETMQPERVTLWLVSSKERQ